MSGLYSQSNPFPVTPGCAYVVRPVPAENESAQPVCWIYERAADGSETALDTFPAPLPDQFDDARPMWVYCAGYMWAMGYGAINLIYTLDWPGLGEVNFAPDRER
jgi:hypothetical protein